MQRNIFGEPQKFFIFLRTFIWLSLDSPNAGFPLIFLLFFLGYLGEFRRILSDFLGYFIGQVKNNKAKFRRF